MAEFPLRQSKRVQGLSPKLPPIARERPLEAIEQGAQANSHVEDSLAMEVGEEFNTYDNPLVEQPLMAETSFHFLMEGHVISSSWVDLPSNDTEGT